MRSDKRHKDGAARQAAQRDRNRSVQVEAVKTLIGWQREGEGPFNWKRWSANLRLTATLLRDCYESGRAFTEDRPDGWEDTDHGQKFVELLDALDSALTEIESSAA